jgi:dipeptidyl aminopeptidase/acylaminoacyl peptidase
MIGSDRLLRAGSVLFQVASILLAPLVTHSQNISPETKRPITVADAIGMIRLADPDYFHSGSSKGRVAQFSPDGKRFVVALRRGNLDKNVNEFSLLLFQSADVFSSSRPDRLLTMSSSSNRDAIHALKWLADNETIAFLAENPGEVPQLYTINVRTRRLEKLTNHPTAVTSYDITPDGREIIFAADPPAKRIMGTEQTRREGIVITSQDLEDIIAGDSAKSWESQLFFEGPGQSPVLIPLEDTLYEGSPLSVSPKGRYALVGGNVRGAPAGWVGYEDPVHTIVISKRPRGGTLPLRRYLLVDAKDGSVTPLLNTPMLGLKPITWTPDGRSVLIEGTYLPLDITDPVEREERRKKSYDVEVTLSSKEYRKLAKMDWPKQGNGFPELEVSLQEDINTPPTIYVSNSKTNENALLLNLNPQFSELTFGIVKSIEWKVDGIEVIGGLYLPPDYTPEKRYPVVIQTHGFVPEQFSMDGRSEWSGGFAARPLAANGIIVLQLSNFKNQHDHDRVGIYRDLGVTEAQRGKNFSLHLFEGAVDYLDGRGLVDRNRVGIVGFSRTVCFVAYALTHSKYRFAAASLIDGIDCGYFQYMAFPDLSWDFNNLNGGAPPFGDGLKEWIKESPGFNLDKVHAPVRLLALQPFAVLEAWEWFAGLNLQGKPVDLIEIPDASHLMQKPWERRIAQQGMVDWFRFWLKGEEDLDPAKAQQYVRWRELRKTHLSQVE